jgi:tetratricopeptide (TPR) repeat protein
MIRLLIIFAVGSASLGATVQIAYAQAPARQPAQIAASQSPKQLIGTAADIAVAATSSRDFSEMIYYLDKALSSRSIVPEHRTYARKLKGWAHNRLGENFAEQGKEAAALTQFELAVELNFKHWKALHNRGVSYAMDGRLEEAAQDFSATIRLNPAYANAWFNRAEVFMQQGKTELAIENYSQAIILNPNDAGFYSGRGKAYRLCGKYSQAEDDLNKALKIDGRLATTYVERGDLWLEQGNFEKAAADYQRAVRSDAHLAVAYRRVAWMMATCTDVRYRDTKRAITFSEKAMQLHGEEDFRYLDTLAAAHANANQFSQAVEKQRQAINLAESKATGRELSGLKKRLQQYSRQAPHREERLASHRDNSKRVQ